ncbi:MAG: hypothetical protein MI919_39855 [Holophagales bacterium]|nr:hypothetical protein [Holophagales bacterium]
MHTNRATQIFSSVSIAVFLANFGYAVFVWIDLAGIEVLSAKDWALLAAMLACCIGSGLDIARGGQGVIALLPVAAFYLLFSAIELFEFLESGGDLEPSFFELGQLIPLVVSLILIGLFAMQRSPAAKRQGAATHPERSHKPR